MRERQSLRKFPTTSRSRTTTSPTTTGPTGWATPGSPSPPYTSARAAATPRSAGYLPAGKPSCSGQRSYPCQSVISGNTLVNNGGSVFLWQNSNRYCSDGSDMLCTLVAGGHSGPFTVVRLQGQYPLGLGQHHHLCRQEDRNAAGELVGRLHVENRECADYPEHDRL